MDGELPPDSQATNTNHVMLTEFPIYGEFVNPGIGVQMYDFLVPLHGTEHFSLAKETVNDPGSLSVKSNENTFVKSESQIVSNLKQEGFGDIQNEKEIEINKDAQLDNPIIESSELSNNEKIKKLGPIFDAMQKAKVQTSALQFKPKKTISKGLKKKKTNNFHLV